MNIGFAGNLEKEGIAELRERLMQSAKAQHADCVALCSAQDIRELVKAPDLLVVIGGDGTLLRFAAAAVTIG